MKKIKKFSLYFSFLLILLVVFSAFGLSTTLALKKSGTSFEQVEAQTLSDNSGATLGKISSLSKNVESSSLEFYSVINKKGNSVLGKSQQMTKKRRDYVEGEILVKYKEIEINLETFSGRTAAINFSKVMSMEKKEDLKKSNISVLKIKDGKTVEQKIAELENDPRVEYVEPNYLYYSSEIATDDTHKGLLWGLHNIGQTVNAVTSTLDADIDVPEAWVISEAATSTLVIVAVIDSGVAYNHPDLFANMWDGSSCKDENGVLVDGGCNHGYDYEDGDKTPLPTDSSHGSHVAGTIAAIKNNSKGIVGVAPQAKIMALKAGGENGLSNSAIIKSIDFAIQNGAKVINASFGGNASSSLQYEAIDRFRISGGIFIAAAGNDATNNDVTPFYPSGYDLPNIISVAATDQNDLRSTFSNYGTSTVHVGAPGSNIYSTVPLITNSTQLDESFTSVEQSAIPSGWTKNGYWGVFDATSYLGSSWGNVLRGDLNSPYLSNSDSIITIPTINLSGATAGYVDFWASCDTEYITNGWVDYMQLEYSADGVTFSTTTDPYFDGEFRWDEPTFDILNEENPLDSTGNSVFHYQNISIPKQYLTNNFKLRFRWVTNSSDNSYNGCVVDDVKVIKKVVSDGLDEQYGYSNGTSMAAPHVAGLAALIKGYNPDLTVAQVKNIILTSGDTVPSLATTTSSGKRINAQKALQSANPAKAITSFSFATPSASGVITESATSTITVTVPFGTNVTTLIATFITTGASVSVGTTTQVSATTTNNFTTPVTYVVTAADGSTKTYAVMVTFDANPAKAITSFSFATPSASGVITESATSTITVTVPFGTNVTTLIATFITTGASVAVGTTTQVSATTTNNFTTPVTYVVTAVDASTKTYTVTVTKVTATQTIPGANGSVTIDRTTPNLVVSSPTQAVTVTVPLETINATVNFSALITNGTGTLPATTIDTTSADIYIPAATIVTSTDTSWNGIMQVPAVALTLTLPVTSGQTKTLSLAVKMGVEGIKLTFSKGVKIVMANQKGKKAGYSISGNDFTEITTVCNSVDGQTVIDAQLVGAVEDCKIDSGEHLVVWTKHFTTFATYTQKAKVVSSGGGGGGGYVPLAVPTATVAMTTPVVATSTITVPTQVICPAGHLFSIATGVRCTTSSTTSLLASGIRVSAEVRAISINLTIGSKGDLVQALQQFLVSQNIGNSAKALQANGLTKNFGNLTKAALAEWQKSVGITPSTGYYGPKTRAKIKELTQ